MRKDATRAFAILESALVTVVLMTLIIGGLAATQIIRRVDAVRTAADRPLQRLEVRPLRIRFNSAGDPEVQVDVSALRQALSEAGRGAESMVQHAMRDSGTEGQPYFIEARFAVVHVDPTSGEPTGTVEFPPFSTWTTGSLSPDSRTNQRTNLEQHFRDLVERTGGVGGGSLFAIPTGVREGDSEWRYLPRTALVGLRVVTSLGDEMTTRIWGQMSDQENIGARKAIVIRALME